MNIGTSYSNHNIWVDIMATYNPGPDKEAEEERLREQKRREDAEKEILREKVDQSRSTFTNSGIDSFFDHYQKNIEDNIGFHDG